MVCAACDRKLRDSAFLLDTLDGVDLIFLVWLVLLVFPLFTEIEFLGVKLKREVERIRDEVRNSSLELRQQMLENRMVGANSVTNSFQAASVLPSKAELEQAEQKYRKNALPVAALTDVPEQPLALFKARYTLENQIRSICAKAGYDGIPAVSAMIRYLNQREYINGNTATLAAQIYQIASRGMHGEIVSSEYTEFVRQVLPAVISALDAALSHFIWQECPQCGEKGYFWRGICPKCHHVA